MTGYLSFYASKIDKCLVNRERVKYQEGDFYGGWLTNNFWLGRLKELPGHSVGRGSIHQVYYIYALYFVGSFIR